MSQITYIGKKRYIDLVVDRADGSSTTILHHPVPARLRSLSSIIISIGHTLRQQSLSDGGSIVTRVNDWVGHVNDTLYTMTDDQAFECAVLGLYSIGDWLDDGRSVHQYQQAVDRRYTSYTEEP